MRRAATRLLRHLDEVVVPRLARGFARLGRGRLRLRFLNAGALFGVTAILITAVWMSDRTGSTSSDDAIGPTVRVGVSDGQSISDYVRSTEGELATLLEAGQRTSQEVYALVVLRAYLAPERLTPVLGGVTVAHVYARVPLPGVQTQIVRIPAVRIPHDVATGMEQVAQRRLTDAGELADLAAKLTGDGEGELELRHRYGANAQLATAEATAFRDGCACVYAAVIRATPAALDLIAARPEVRVVDPAPEVQRLDQAVFLPPVPEQQEPIVPLEPSPAQPSVQPSVPPASPEPGPADPSPSQPQPTDPASADPGEPEPSQPAPEPSVSPTDAGGSG